jgi:hypothetical protein
MQSKQQVPERLHDRMEGVKCGMSGGGAYVCFALQWWPFQTRGAHHVAARASACGPPVPPPPFTQSACRHAAASKNRSLERNGLLAHHAIYESVGANLACLLGAELARHAQWKATPTMQDQIVSFAPPTNLSQVLPPGFRMRTFHPKPKPTHTATS